MTDIATPEVAPPAAPEAPEAAPEGFTADALASDQKPTLPDQSILADRVHQIVSRDQQIDQRRQQEQQYADLQDELQFLRRLHGERFEQKYDEVSGKVSAADDDQSQIMKKIQAELEQLKTGKSELEQRMVAQQREAELEQARRDVVAWVKSQEQHFPLINALGEPQLVLQKMLEYEASTGQMISETRATGEVEQQLSSIVDKLAPLLGYSKGEPKRTDDDESVSINNAMNVTTKAIDPKNMSDQERMEYLIRKHTQNR